MLVITGVSDKLIAIHQGPAGSQFWVTSEKVYVFLQLSYDILVTLQYYNIRILDSFMQNIFMKTDVENTCLPTN